MTPDEAYEKARESDKIIPELEAIISKDAYWSYWYALYVIKGRFILAEPAISKNAFYSFLYARYVIKGILPDFMHNRMILSNDKSVKEYVEFISKNPDSLNNKI